jgi:hypothetical protein
MQEYLTFLKTMHDILTTILDFFKNPSVAAFIGAFAAFMLIFLTDKRRNKRKKQLVLQLLKNNYRLGEDKLWAINNIIETLKSKKQLIGGPLQPFDVQQIKTLGLEILDLFNPDEQNTLNTICFHLKEINDLLESVAEKCELLRNRKIPHRDERAKILETINNDYIDARDNILRVQEYIKFYLSNDFQSILNIIYSRENEPIVKDE